MAEEKNYKIGIEIDATDTATPKVEQAQKTVDTFEERAKKLGKAGQDGMSAFGRKVDESRRKMDQAGGTADRMRRRLEGLRSFARSGADFLVRVKETGISRIRGLLGGLRNAIFGLPGLLGAGAGIAGVKSLVLDPALEFEKQQISMLHWVNGNKARAKAATTWVQQFGAATPFTTEDIFPAFTRGLGVENGDIEKAKKLTVLAGNMAALTPGKTMRDAMEALADAKMGEFERMKEFNVKLLKSSAGSWDDIVKKLNKKFAGGAEALSKSAGGLISTIQDNVQIGLRSLGTGFWERLKPTLQKVVDWFNDHPKDVEGFFTKFEEWGGKAADQVIKVYNAINDWLKPIMESKAWKEGDFGDRFILLFSAGLDALEKWLDGPGSKKMEGVISRLLEIGITAYGKLLNTTWDITKSGVKEGDPTKTLGGWMALNKETGNLPNMAVGYAVVKGAEWGVKAVRGKYFPKPAGTGGATTGEATAKAAETAGERGLSFTERQLMRTPWGKEATQRMAMRAAGNLGRGVPPTEEATAQLARSLFTNAAKDGWKAFIGGGWKTFAKGAAVDAIPYAAADYGVRYAHGKTVEAFDVSKKAGRQVTQQELDFLRNTTYPTYNFPIPEKPSTAKNSKHPATNVIPTAAIPPIQITPLRSSLPFDFMMNGGKMVESTSHYQLAMNLEADRGGRRLYTTTAAWYQKLGTLTPPPLPVLPTGGIGGGNTFNISIDGSKSPHETAREVVTQVKRSFENTPH